MPMRLIAELERIRYREGQLLAARDLQDDKDFQALLRWMHTRFLHNTWGLALGLDAELVELGDSSKVVRVSPGLAYDGYGREILLTQSIEVDVPMAGGDEDFYLVIRYKVDDEFPRKPDVVAVCLPEETDPKQERPIFHPLKEQPVFFWKRRDSVRLGEEVPLACWCFDEPSGQMVFDPGVRRNARPLIRPHIGWGATKPGQTSWEEWKLNNVVIGFQVIVDTSEAGFTQTPCYFAFLQGDLWSQDVISSFILGPFESIVGESADRFTFRIMLPTGMTIEGKDVNDDLVNDDFKNHFLAIAKEQAWHVFWIGVEPRIVTFAFAGRVVSLPPADPEHRRLGPWHIQIEGEAPPRLVWVSKETVVDESEAQAKLDTWAEIQARPVIDGFWEAVHIKLHNFEG